MVETIIYTNAYLYRFNINLDELTIFNPATIAQTEYQFSTKSDTALIHYIDNNKGMKIRQYVQEGCVDIVGSCFRLWLKVQNDELAKELFSKAIIEHYSDCILKLNKQIEKYAKLKDTMYVSLQ